jgi:hypothetical protein
VTSTLFTVVTHRFDRAVYQQIARVADQLRGEYAFSVYHDARVQPDFRFLGGGYPVISFNFEKIRTKFPLLARADIIPGNQYAAYIDLLPLFPQVRYFWFVEYDVRFSGNWRTLLDGCSHSSADLLGCHIRTREEIPGWSWWPGILSKREPQKQLLGIRAFTWAIRLSRGALELVAQRCIQDGWTGHMEGLVPSLLFEAGMLIEEIGGRGPFTPKERQGLFYSSEYGFSSPSPNGDLGLGGNRHGPPLFAWGMRKNRLYHPVKTGRTLRTLASALEYKRDSALDLLKRSVLREHFRTTCETLKFLRSVLPTRVRRS